jgi:hypothetical protein
LSKQKAEAKRQAPNFAAAEPEKRPKPPEPEPERLRSLCVYGHSNFFYWWVVWAYGFVCALLTGFNGHTADGPASAPYFYPGAWVGVSFVTVLLFVTFFAHFRLKGPASFIAILIVMLAAFIMSYLYPSYLPIYMNFAFYVSLSTVLLALWLLATFVLDSLTYWQFTPGQVTRRYVFEEGSESYDAHGVHIERVADDILINKILGLRFLGFGTADLKFTTVGWGGVRERFTIENVRRANLRDEQIREVAVVRPAVAP